MNTPRKRSKSLSLKPIEKIIRVLSNHLSWIVLIQNEGSSKVDYEMAKYVDDSPGVSPTVAGVIGGVIGAVSVLLIVLGVFIYKKCADRKLAE